MTKPVTIIEVKSDTDWDKLRELSKELQLFEQSIRPERKPYNGISEGSFNYLKNNVADHDGVALLALSDTGDAVGFMTAWAVDGDGLDKGNNRLGEISDAYITPGYRNSYTFKKMGLMVASHFKNLGSDRITFQTLATNTRMQDLFTTLGFKPHKISFEIKLDDLIA